jgi:hypothetical protein
VTPGETVIPGLTVIGGGGVSQVPTVTVPVPENAPSGPKVKVAVTVLPSTSWIVCGGRLPTAASVFRITWELEPDAIVMSEPGRTELLLPVSITTSHVKPTFAADTLSVARRS